MGDAGVDKEIILGAASGNRAIEVARVSLNQIRMKATHADFDHSSLPRLQDEQLNDIGINAIPDQISGIRSAVL